MRPFGQEGKGSDQVSEDIRTVIVGAGRFGTLHARVWQEAGADIVAVVDVDPARATKVATIVGARYDGVDLETVLKRTPVDIVVIATDENTHSQLSLIALSAGCHVFLEKPFAMSYSQALKTIQAARLAKREVIAGHISRFAEPYRAMRTALSDGRIGDLWSLRLRRDFSRQWYQDFGHRVDPVWESCIHDIDLALSFVGRPGSKVYAARGEAAGDSANSIVSAIVEFEGGIVATIETAWTVPAGAPQTESGALELPGAIVAEAEAHGSQGVMRQRLQNDGLTIVNDTGSWSPNAFLWPLSDDRVGGAIRAEVEYSMNLVKNGISNTRMPMMEAAWGIALAEAITRSLRIGAPVAPRNQVFK